MDQKKPEADRPRVVLFVDDEPAILKALKREFFRSGYKVLMVTSAEDGLQVLDKVKVDLVVSDVRMPGMDGIRFLELVRERHPDVHRVILSGYVNQTSVVQAIAKGCATAYFAKPWEAEVLVRNVQHIMKIRDKMRSEDLLETMNHVDELPPLAEVYESFVEAVSAERPIPEIAGIIAADIALQARILQVANSAFYGSGNIATVDQALMRLGLDAVKNMILAFSFVEKMHWTPEERDRIQEIFDHSSRVNKFTKYLYEKRHGKKLARELSSLGIVHDIGKILLLQYFKDRFRAVKQTQAENPVMTFHEAERALGYPVNHGEMGAYLLDVWNLPTLLVQAALFHHEPAKAGGRYADVIETLSLSDCLVELMELQEDVEEPDLHCFGQDFLSEQELAELVAQIRADIRGESVVQT